MPGVLEQIGSALNIVGPMPDSGTLRGAFSKLIHPALGLGPEKPAGTTMNNILSQTVGL